MATLFQTSSQLRRILVFVLIAVVVILVVDNVSRFIQSGGINFGTTTSYYAKSNTVLGTIPATPMKSFPISSSSNPTFVKVGSFLSYPDTVLVYTIDKPREKLTTVESAVTTAAALGFSSSYTSISTDEISWQNALSTRTLIFNKVTQTWRLRTKYPFDAAAQAVKSLYTNANQYEGSAVSIASRLGFTELSLQQGKAVAVFALLGSDGLFTSPVDKSGTNYVSLDVFRQLTMTKPKAPSELPGVKANTIPAPVSGTVYRLDPLYGPLYGSLHMIVSNKASTLTEDVYELDFTNYLYNYTNVGIRDIITPDEALDLVRQGQGALAQIRLDTADYFALNQTLNVTKFSVDTTQTELAYFEPDPWDGFVYPIYVFKGKADTDKGSANFTFFVDALKRFVK